MALTFQPWQKNPVGAFTQGAQAGQQMKTTQQKQAYDAEILKTLPALLQAELGLAQSNAATGAVTAQYAPQMAESEYLKSLSNLDKSRADVRLLNNAIKEAEATLPYALKQAEMNQKMQEFFHENGIYTPEAQKIVSEEMAFAFLDQLQGLATGSAGAPSVGGGMNGAVAEEITEKTSPDDYLPGMSDKYAAGSSRERYQEKRLPETVLAGKKAQSEERARQDVKAYTKYSQQATDSATLASSQNQTLEQMRSVWERIPEGQKGIFLGQLKPISGASQIFESLQSGLTLDELARQKGTASEGDRAEIKNKFGGRQFTNDSFDELTTFMEIMNDRAIEKQKFISDNSEYSEGQLESSWNKWLKDNSIFDSPRYKEFNERRKQSMSPSERLLDEKNDILKLLSGGK